VAANAKGRRVLAAAAAAIAIAAVAIFFLSSSGDALERPAAIEQAAADQAGLAPGSSAGAVPAISAAVGPPAPHEEGGFAPPTGVRDPNWGQHDPVMRNPLEAYLRQSIYPPQSRPLGVQNDDLLNPNQRYEETKTSEDGQIQFRFSADKVFVVGAEPLSSFLEVRRGGRLIPVEITTAFAAVLEPGKLLADLERIPLSFTPSEGLYVNVFAAGELPGLRDSVTMGIYIEFDYGGAAPVRDSFTIHVTATESIPARFTGEFGESIVDGSLVIEAGLEVHQAGHYLIDCNLHDDEGYPVAWTRFKGELEAGRHDVPLSFFGKVLVDSRATPPFHIGQLRGHRFIEGRDPDLETIPPFEGTYVTRRYALDEFSDAEWDSPHKQATIERLTELGPTRFPD
jgi:hypothetical protein